MKKIILYIFTLSHLFVKNYLFSQQKIVSLTPSITESLYLLGIQDNVVGITTFCRKYSKKQKIVGTYLEPNIEEIIKLNPNLVFISKEGVRKEIVDNLAKFNIKIIVFESVNNYDEIKQQFIEIARYIEKEDVAKNIIKEYEEKFKRLKNPSKTKSVLCIISLQPLIVASENSYIGNIIAHSGGVNCVKSTLKYPQINPEEIIRLDPEIIILPEMGINNQEIKQFFRNFKNISAVKKNKIFVLQAELLCQPNIKNYYYAVKKLNEIIKE